MPAPAPLAALVIALAPPPPATPAATLATPTRAGLTLAWRRFDHAVSTLDLSDEQFLEAGLAFDRASAALLRGGPTAVYRGILEATDALLLDNPDAPAAVAARTLRLRMDPPVFIRGDTQPPRLRFDRFFETDAPAEPVALTVRLIPTPPHAGDAPVAASTFNILATPSGPPPDPLLCPIPDGGFAPGRYTVEICLPDAAGCRVSATWTVVPTRPETVRDRIAAAIDDLERKGRLADPALSRAAAVLRSRNALLTSNPSTNDPAHLDADLSRLPDQLTQELAALESGRNPYANYPGHLWRTVRIADADVPVRMFNPPPPPGEAAAPPRPLVIALHGAGGDESTFPEAYGDGIITRLAAQHGFVLAAPRTGPFAADPAFFDGLLAAITADYTIDPARIYVLGHSLGSGVTGAWAAARADRIAAAACIAGFTAFDPEQRTCPTLVVVPGRDGLIKPTRVINAARAAAAAGAPIEPLFLPDQTHTLVVGTILPEVIPWLLKHELSDAPDPPAR